MPFPGTVPLGPWRVPAHPLFEGLGYFLGARLYFLLKRRWRDPVPSESRWAVLGGALLGGGLGAKALHFLTLLPQRAELGWLPLLAGKSILGALLGGHLGVELAKRLVGERRRTGDLFVPPLCLGIAIGRVGCFLAGLSDGTYGGPTRLPWGVDFGDGVRRHPTQLYESLLMLVLLGLAFALRQRLRQGQLWRGFLATYCAWRLFVDGLKPYPPVFGLNAIQWAALLGLLALAWGWWRDQALPVMELPHGA